jgi:hypothetical protein
MCFGASAPAAPPAPPPPPQYAQTPSAAVVRANTAAQANSAQNGTLLTTGMGAEPLNNTNLGKQSLLGH